MNFSALVKWSTRKLDPVYQKFRCPLERSTFVANARKIDPDADIALEEWVDEEDVGVVDHWYGRIRENDDCE